MPWRCCWCFLAGIGVNLARGNAPDCHCFGQLHSEPVSWKVFARNAALAVVAMLIVAQGNLQQGLSAFAWLSDLKVGELVTLMMGVVAIGLLVSMLVYLRRVLTQQSSVLEKLDAMKKVIDEDYAEPVPIEREDALPPVEGLPVGALAPGFLLTAFGGGQVSLDDLLAHGKAVLLLFVSPTCSPCKTLLPMVKVWERDYGRLCDHCDSDAKARSKITRARWRNTMPSICCYRKTPPWPTIIRPDGRLPQC